MSDFIQQSKEMINSFEQTPAYELAKNIMNQRDAYSHLKLSGGSNRDVYRIGGFEHENKERHAVLKIPKKLTELTKIVFEAYFFNVCQDQPEINVPSFIMLPKVGLQHGIIVEDISEGGKYAVDGVWDMRFNETLDFLKTDNTYQKGKTEFLHHIIKINPIMNNHRNLMFYMGRSGKEDLETTLFAVHNNKECKRVVCADADQLYENMKGSFHYSSFNDFKGLAFEYK